MKRLLFRCLDTLVDASALECRAFNSAFIESGLSWHWTAAQINTMRKITGDRQRIAWYAEHVAGQPVSASFADIVRWRKEKALTQLLQHDLAVPRPGVLRLLREAATARIQTNVASPENAQKQILSQTARHFNALSALKQVACNEAAEQNTADCIDIDSALISNPVSSGLITQCITLSSTLSGAKACITHFGEINNPAELLSGHNVLHQGNASLQSLQSLESQATTIGH